MVLVVHHFYSASAQPAMHSTALQ